MRIAIQRVAGSRVAGSRVADERVADERVADERVADEQIVDERIAGCDAVARQVLRTDCGSHGAGSTGARVGMDGESSREGA